MKHSPSASRLGAALLVSAAMLAASACSPDGSSGSASEAAADYPTRSIDLVVPFPAGGSTDSVARALVDVVNDAGTLSEPVRVVNREGGAATVGVNEVMQSSADGYTIGFAGAAPFVMQPLVSEVPYDPDAVDPILQIASIGYVVAVAADSPFETLDDVVEAAGEEPRSVSIAQGPLPYNIVVNQIQDAASVEFNAIDFAGDAPALTALLGGNVDVVVGQTASVLAQASGGNVRILAGLSEERSSFLPDTPTAMELGYDVELTLTNFLFGPEGLPDEVVSTLADAFADAAQDPAFTEIMTTLGLTVDVQDAEAVQTQLVADGEKYRDYL